MPNMDRRAFATRSTALAALAAVGLAPALHAAPTNQADELRSRFLLDLSLDARQPSQIGATSTGRLIVPVAGGTFDGPRLKGTVLPPAGDWITERADGSRVLDVRALLKTDDGELIYISWRGIAYTPPGGALFARIVPVFEAASAKYSWLNNLVAVGVYRPSAGNVAYRVYEIL